MLVVSLVLVAVLLAGRGGSDAGAPEAAVVTATPLVATTTNTPEPTVTPEPTGVPALPADLHNRLQALPEKLRNQTLAAYSAGSLSQDQLQQIVTDYENRNPNQRVGSVLSVTEDRLRFEVFTTGEQAEVATNDQTSITRGGTQIALADLMPDELVMVVSTDDGATAQTIDAFGVAAP